MDWSAVCSREVEMEERDGFVARTVLWHSFAFNEHLKGTSAEELRYSVLAPESESSMQLLLSSTDPRRISSYTVEIFYP